ncbi:M48 family metalloprotease [Aquisalinus flavus]|uniref:M48 family metalloprotease n=1 Tax=Aquisalinus flavus TaxID=1526572 RepID=UPI00165F2720|nr:M48 family metalloprotease [Aquisalinus flavus]MBD0427524.1 M48 family metallopeptidase [Aquisalinus flavus]UNE47319.1 M48 family metallopeptidase [Aquisalinus flavus]
MISTRVLKVLKITAAAATAQLMLMASASAQSFLRDAEIEQFLSDYSMPIFEAAGLPAEQIQIHIIGSPDLNAAAGNLHMFVFTGLITEADVPNQIEGVIAHEAGHIAGGHSQRTQEAMESATRPMMMSLVLGTVAILAGAPDAGMGLIGLGQQVGTSNFLRYSRGQESSADQAGLAYLEATGKSGQGLIDFFRKLRNQQLISSYYERGQYYSTHPMANDRMSILERKVKESPYYEVKDTEEEIQRLRMIQAKINGFMLDPQATMRQYPLADQTKPARYARAVAYYRDAQLDKALTEIDRLLEEEPENPFFYELKGQMLFEHGKITESIEPHRVSTELAPQYALLKINHARALVATENTELSAQAIDILKLALNMEKDNYFGWTELARAYSSQGDDTMASLATAEAYFHVGAPHLAHRFATRALDKLPEQTVEWRQASDIVNATRDDALRYQRNNPQGNRPGRFSVSGDTSLPAYRR